MLTNVSYFEQELVRLLEERISDLTTMVMAGNLADYAAYQKRTAQATAFREVIESLIPQANTEVQKAR